METTAVEEDYSWLLDCLVEYCKTPDWQEDINDFLDETKGESPDGNIRLSTRPRVFDLAPIKSDTGCFEFSGFGVDTPSKDSCRAK